MMSAQRAHDGMIGDRPMIVLPGRQPACDAGRQNGSATARFI